MLKGIKTKTDPLIAWNSLNFPVGVLKFFVTGGTFFVKHLHTICASIGFREMELCPSNSPAIVVIHVSNQSILSYNVPNCAHGFISSHEI